jgi:hypothetical protein
VTGGSIAPAPFSRLAAARIQRGKSVTLHSVAKPPHTKNRESTMKTMIVSTVIAFFIASPVHAVPLTWLFSGTTGASCATFSGPATCEFNGISIGSAHFDLRIFLDTDLPAMTFGGLADVFFGGPHQGDVSIATLGVPPVPVAPFSNVQYFGRTAVTGVQYNEPFFSGILFASPISNDSMHLGPIAPTTPTVDNTLDFLLSNGIIVSGQVTTFSAQLVPEGSTALLLTSGLIAFGFLRRRYKRSAS